jgi:transcriptional regulator with XRE-family HTH domain
MNSIHARLRFYRTRKNLTIQEVSNQTGIPASTYKEWENGRQIRGEPYPALSQVFQVSLQELITGNSSPANPVFEQLDGIIHTIDTIKRDLISLF